MAVKAEIIAIGTEPWIAWVNARDSGLGLYLPHVKEATTYRVSNGNAGDCSYLAPLQTFALKPGLIFEYEVTLAIYSEAVSRIGLAKVDERKKLGDVWRGDGDEKVTFEAKVRIDTENELDYFRNGGILHYVLRELARAS